MAADIRWTWRAQRDLVEIGDFIARDKPRAAALWVGRLITAVERAATFPSSGRVVPELGREDLREVLVGRYRVVYQISSDVVIVLTVFEGHRRFDGAVPCLRMLRLSTAVETADAQHAQTWHPCLSVLQPSTSEGAQVPRIPLFRGPQVPAP